MSHAMMTERIERALLSATETKFFWLGEAMLERVPKMFTALFPGSKACLIADGNTLAAAGREVYAALRAQGVEIVTPFIFDKPPHVDLVSVEKVMAYLKEQDAIAVAVGAGSINDICKVASFRLGCGYLCVATAASVDGYASSGAPMTVDGFKKTVPCSAPLGIVADLAVLQRAPYELTASGYADLVAKVPAGADWIIADVLGAGNEPILDVPWAMVQSPLESWINHPYELKNGERSAFSDLFEGLTLSGLAMQAANSSRPASGCEHMFSHLWEMSGVKRPDGTEPSHGFKVAIGSLASIAAMESLFSDDFRSSDIAEAVNRYPSWSERESMIRKLFGDNVCGEKVIAESKAKYLEGDALLARLEKIASSWEEMKAKVERQIMSFTRMREMFRVAGCPIHPREIGVNSTRCAASAIAAQMIRSRYTVLDLAFDTGRLYAAVEAIGAAWEE